MGPQDTVIDIFGSKHSPFFSRVNSRSANLLICEGQHWNLLSFSCYLLSYLQLFSGYLLCKVLPEVAGTFQMLPVTSKITVPVTFHSPCSLWKVLQQLQLQQNMLAFPAMLCQILC